MTNPMFDLAYDYAKPPAPQFDLSGFQPGMAGGPAPMAPGSGMRVTQRPVPQMPAAPPRRLSIWDKLAGVPEGVTLTPAEKKQARRAGLMAIAQGFWNSNSPGAPAIAPALGAAGPGAAGGVAQGDEWVTRRLMQAQQAKQAAFYQKYEGADFSDPKVIQEMFLHAAATPGMEKTVGQLGEVLKSRYGQGSQGPLIRGQGINPATGRLESFVQHPGTPPMFSGVEANDPQKALKEQRNIQNENQLSDDYYKQVNPILPGYNLLTRTVHDLDAAKKGNGAAQVQAIYAFINTMDNTAVREGEQHLLIGAAPLIDRVKAWLTKTATDKSAAVPEGMLNEMGEILTRLKSSKENALGSYRTTFIQRGKRANLAKPEEVFPDVRDFFKPDEPKKTNFSGITY